MGVHSVQIATNAATATPLFVSGTGGAGNFKNVSGAVGDQLPTSIRNIDATITIYIGDSGVTAGTGYPLFAKDSVPISWLGTDATALYAIAASGTPAIAILAGRQ